MSILSGVVADPFGYGRIVRNDEGDVEAIVEEKDATPQQREIPEISSGILAFDAEFLVGALPRLTNDNAKGEFYLTDTVRIAREDGLTVGAFAIDDVMQTEGVNDRVQLAEMGREMNRRIVTRWMRDGVTVMDPATTWIDADVKLAEDVTLLPGVQLLGATVGGRGRRDRAGHHAQGLRGRGWRPGGPHPRRARRHRDGASVGPFAYLRPGTVLGAAARSARSWRPRTPRSARAPRCRTCRTSATPRSASSANIGAGTIFANYDGVAKHRTVVGRWPGRLQQHVRGPGRDRRRRLDRRRHRGTPQRAAGGPGGLGGPQRNLAGWVQSKRAGTPQAEAAETGARPSDLDPGVRRRPG